MDKKKALTLHCSVEATIAVLGGKYKAIILWHLNVSGVMRYNEIQKAIPQATAKMLSQQLKELENDGIVKRKLYPVVPPRTEYSLTEQGKTLIPIVNAMSAWGHEYFKYLGIPDPCPEDWPFFRSGPVPAGSLFVSLSLFPAWTGAGRSGYVYR